MKKKKATPKSKPKKAPEKGPVIPWAAIDYIDHLDEHVQMQKAIRINERRINLYSVMYCIIGVAVIYLLLKGWRIRIWEDDEDAEGDGTGEETEA